MLREKIKQKYKENNLKFTNYYSEMNFIRDSYRQYKDTHQLLFKIEGQLLNIDDTLSHYEKILYNLYVELYEIEACEKIFKKLKKKIKSPKFSKKNRR